MKKTTDTAAALLMEDFHTTGVVYESALHELRWRVEDLTRSAIAGPALDLSPLANSDEAVAIAKSVVDHVERVLERMGTGPACVELMRSRGEALSAVDDVHALWMAYTAHPDWSAREDGRGPSKYQRNRYVPLAKEVIVAGVARVRQQLVCEAAAGGAADHDSQDQAAVLQ